MRARLASLINSEIHLPAPTRRLNALTDSGDRGLFDGLFDGFSQDQPDGRVPVPAPGLK
jgi:hypothetical protein